MHQRRILIFLLLGLVGLLGVFLFNSVRPSTMFSLSASAPSQALPGGISPTLAGPLSHVSSTTLLEKPRYTGQDALGRNWSVQAENALQGGTTTSGTYILQHVIAEWHDTKQHLTLNANQGDYSQASATIQLSGNVQATGMGLTLTAPRMDANLTTRYVQASGGSHVTGTVGKASGGWHINIHAPTIVADSSRSTLLFTGGVRAKLTPTK